MIRFITDSTCDVPKARQAEMGLEVLPLTIHFGEQSYAEGVDIDNATFYKKLREVKTLPTTSQVNPAQFEAVFRQCVEKGDQVVGIFISSKLSGTWQSAQIAAQMVGSPDIHIVDSLTATIGTRLLLEIATELRDAGRSAVQIAAEIKALADRVTIYAVVDTLKYLKMGGRLSAAEAVLGSVLGINPVIALGNGMVDSVAKARGKAAAYRKMGELYKACPKDTRYGIAVGHTDCPGELEHILEAIAGDAEPAHIYSGEIGSVIGTHVGPRAAGVAFIGG